VSCLSCWLPFRQKIQGF